MVKDAVKKVRGVCALRALLGAFAPRGLCPECLTARPGLGKCAVAATIVYTAVQCTAVSTFIAVACREGAKGEFPLS